MKFIATLICFFSANALAADCMQLEESGDGIPAAYYQARCLAEDAFSKARYPEAAKYYEQASSIRIFEAPNYALRLEWAEALCLSGKKNEGKKLLKSFELMARADLGEFKCPKEIEKMKEAIQQEHMELACVGYGSSLSEEGKIELKKKLKRVPEVKVKCKDA